MLKRKSGRKLTRYPVPGPVGGILIRKVIGAFRVERIPLPLTSHILIGVSGGPDSLALAHLLTKYGRRVGAKSKMTVAHVNHGWRGEESRRDAKFVRTFALKRKIGFVSVDQGGDRRGELGESHEARARRFRYTWLEKQAVKRKALVLTAHTLDDRFETLVWRFFTGNLDGLEEGIRRRDGIRFRPFLEVSKEEIQQFLKEEGLVACEDSSNADTRYLRSRMRRDLIPAITAIFPKAPFNFEKLSMRRASQRVDFFKEIINLSGARISGAQLDQARSVFTKIVGEWSDSSVSKKRRASSFEICLPSAWVLKFDSKSGTQLRIELVRCR